MKPNRWSKRISAAGAAADVSSLVAVETVTRLSRLRGKRARACPARIPTSLFAVQAAHIAQRNPRVDVGHSIPASAGCLDPVRARASAEALRIRSQPPRLDRREPCDSDFGFPAGALRPLFQAEWRRLNSLTLLSEIGFLPMKRAVHRSADRYR